MKNKNNLHGASQHNNDLVAAGGSKCRTLGRLRLPLQSIPNRKSILGVLVLWCVCLNALAQPKPFEPGSVSKEDLAMKVYEAEPDAAALTLYDYGKARFTAKDDGLQVLYRYHQQIKILKPEGLEAGTFVIPLQVGKEDRENLLSVEAITYNLVDGKVQKTVLKDEEIYRQNTSQWTIEARFTMPALRVGSVIEVIYTKSSPFFFKLENWWFQGSRPVRRCEYSVVIPEFYEYKVAQFGYLPYAESSSSKMKENYHLLNHGNVQADAMQYYWRMENLPSFKKEPYMFAPRDYRSHLEFELASYQYPGQVRKVVTSDWSTFAKDALERNQEWSQASNGGGLKKITEVVVGDAKTWEEKAERIYTHLQRRMEWNGAASVYPEQTAQETYDLKHGSVADLHATLLGMLWSADLNAHPVFLSTIGNGRISEESPMLSTFDYVVIALEEGGKTQFLDITDAMRPMGMLPSMCLGGKCVILDAENTRLEPCLRDEIDLEVLNVQLALTEDGYMSGDFKRQLGGIQAYHYRIAAADTTYAKEDGALAKVFWRTFPGWRIEDEQVEGIQELEEKIVHKGKVLATSLVAGTDDLLYVAPLSGFGISESLFQQTNRIYPVDIGYPIKRHVQVELAVPAGYQVDEVPSGIQYVLPDGGGRFRFTTNETGGKVFLSSTISLDKGNYHPGYYSALKEMFDSAVSKHLEPVVFKKRP